jgi:hypothetical protein
MFIPTLLNPNEDIRAQIYQTNASTPPLPQMELSRYLPQGERADAYLALKTAPKKQRNTILIETARKAVVAALVTEHELSEEEAITITDICLLLPEAHPDQAVSDKSIAAVDAYIQELYKIVRLEMATATMQEFRAYHDVYAPRSKFCLLDPAVVIKRMQNPDKVATAEEAEKAFEAERMQCFSILYSMSALSIASTVPVPALRDMMLPMAYQLWKNVILAPPKNGEKEADDVMKGKTKTLKQSLRAGRV